jgi:Zn-dependent protease
MPNRQGSIHLFRFKGIDVFLHWSWFLVAVYEIQRRAGNYSSVLWNVLEYLALFAIVLTHEYGHALACRQVGGTANQIVLWPLGGVAYVDPPQRPGPMLWSLAAGPLVNVVLLPVLFVVLSISRALHWEQSLPNLSALIWAVFFINLVLLVFNVLPIYPLDGGQILRSLLWFVIGRARSLMVATLIGFVGIAAMFILAFRSGSLWYGVLAFFLVLNCWAGMKHSLHLLRFGRLPHNSGFACPWCQAAPPAGRFWTCASCQTPVDPFATNGVCSYCGAALPGATCPECGRANLLEAWRVGEKIGAATR